jgi:hypothetical protein
LMVISSVLVIMAALRAGRLDELELAPLGPRAATDPETLSGGRFPPGNLPPDDVSSPPTP